MSLLRMKTRSRRKPAHQTPTPAPRVTLNVTGGAAAAADEIRTSSAEARTSLPPVGKSEVSWRWSYSAVWSGTDAIRVVGVVRVSADPCIGGPCFPWLTSGLVRWRAGVLRRASAPDPGRPRAAGTGDRSAAGCSSWDSSQGAECNLHVPAPKFQRLVAAPHVDVDVPPLDLGAGIHDRVDAVVPSPPSRSPG